MSNNYCVKPDGLSPNQLRRIILFIIILSATIVPMISSAASSKNPLHKVELTADQIKTIGISEALDIPGILKHFPVSEIYKGSKHKLQLSSHQGSKKFKTLLQQGTKNGPNFAGHYTIVEIGCGTSCLNIWIIDTRSGKILEGPYNTAWGAEYNLNSRLLILNPLPLDADKSYLNHPAITDCDSTYMLMDQGKFKILFKEKMENLLQEKFNRSCGQCD